MSIAKPRKSAALLILLMAALTLAPGKILAGQPSPADETLYPVPPPLVYQGLFPCQACHRRDAGGPDDREGLGPSFLGRFYHAPDPTPRLLVQMHQDIELKHADWQWCLNCHDLEERNSLKLITGEKIPFEQSYRLCGQCHGQIYNDWKMGIHGRRVGQWNGDKLYLLCAHCHDPHSPRFRKLMAQEPPKPPGYGRWESAQEASPGH